MQSHPVLKYPCQLRPVLPAARRSRTAWRALGTTSWPCGAAPASKATAWPGRSGTCMARWFGWLVWPPQFGWLAWPAQCTACLLGPLSLQGVVGPLNLRRLLGLLCLHGLLGLIGLRCLLGPLSLHGVLAQPAGFFACLARPTHLHSLRGPLGIPCLGCSSLFSCSASDAAAPGRKPRVLPHSPRLASLALLVPIWRETQLGHSPLMRYEHMLSAPART